MRLISNLKKEDYLIKDNMGKKDIDLLKKDPKKYLQELSKDDLVNLIQKLNYSYYIEGKSLVSVI